MRNSLGVISLTLLLFSCGNKGRQESSTILIDDRIEESFQQSDTTVEDSIEMDEVGGDAPVVLGAHSSYGAQDDDYDNMRGFDPASEDDMDDNGMSRYMENDDEEGWE